MILEGINKHVNNEKYGIEMIHICDTASRIRRFTEKTGFRPESDKLQGNTTPNATKNMQCNRGFSIKSYYMQPMLCVNTL